MDHIVIKDNQGNEWGRVSKPAARKAFNEGRMVTISPVKLHPFGRWSPSLTRAGASDYADFETLVNNFEWFNCNAEAGLYSAFYVQAAQA